MSVPERTARIGECMGFLNAHFQTWVEARDGQDAKHAETCMWACATNLRDILNSEVKEGLRDKLRNAAIYLEEAASELDYAHTPDRLLKVREAVRQAREAIGGNTAAGNEDSFLN
jgi:hypothetical protein